ncbi:hypothetical protein [Heyndrickxia oleronia]|jgi:hypothetical protein|uniref:hypothetical protein n=1 Tax=Heyndrickxia oleronia TaxID=38875 RepID=UPI00242A5ACD|nr:hypothetical protein [Heyndrickxia oleronia]MCI1593116.1 hypothetical protein [Heyndrickxia oleronia]MCI1615743.1 hypothetical protein [Heyndrickxia oleronia]MCI1746375.1 hypothetical protein [Heyndrickxia oleronia]MCI1764065.1 hypothetical protein [Heyndrickxia oleronia]
MHYCHLCGERIEKKEGYIGTKEEKLIHSCFNCYIGTLEPIKFDNEKVRYPLVGLRGIQLHDSIAFYNVAGKELARIYLKSYNEGMIDFIKSELQRDLGITEDELIIIIEPFDVKLKV